MLCGFEGVLWGEKADRSFVGSERGAFGSVLLMDRLGTDGVRGGVLGGVDDAREGVPKSGMSG